MDFIDKYPYTDFHELNLDWLLARVRELASQMEGWQAANTITYGGSWDITKQYPAWTVVVNDEYGYISIKPVPEGIALTNTAYWENIADFSALYADLGSRVTALESDMIGVKFKTNALTSWSNRRVLWAGDSYGNGWDGTQSLTDPYTIASNKLGCSYVNVSHGGCRFGHAGTDAQYRYRTYIKDYVDNHTDMASFTDVIIIGGANDIIFNPSDDISGEIATTVNYVKANFPNAKIRIGMVARLANTGAANCTLNNTLAVMSRYKTGATNNGVEYIEGSELINHNYNILASDGIHLSSYSDMGNKLASLLLSGGFNKYIVSPTHIVPEATTDANSLAPTILNTNNTTQSGSEILMDIIDLQFQFNDPVAITWKKAYKFAKISGDTSTRNLFCGWTAAQRINMPAVFRYNYDGNNIHSIQPVTIYIYDNYLYISWDGLIESEASMTECTEIDLRTGFEFAFNEAYC